MKKILELYNEYGFTELMNELNQLKTMKTIDPLNMEYMTIEQKHLDLQYLVFLTKNKSGHNYVLIVANSVNTRKRSKHMPLQCIWRLLCYHV